MSGESGFGASLDSFSEMRRSLVGPRGGSREETRGQVQIRYARGDGIILEGDPAPYHNVPVRWRPARRYRAGSSATSGRGARLRLGELVLADGVPCLADAAGFDRHTFLCGQSGSGKTYSLGVILERLLIETGLRVVVLDPNSVRRPGAGTRLGRRRAGRALPGGGRGRGGLLRSR